MLREDVGNTFSDIWYRVGGTRPKLSVHANVIRQHYGPTISFIVEEPASGYYYRLTPSAYLFLGLLDGRRTVDEAWETCCAQLGDDAPTQRECIDLLSKLQMFGLLIGDMPLAADMVLERKRQARQAKLRRRTGNWMFFSVPLFNPEPFLERHKIITKAIFSRAGLILWSLTVLTALVMVGRNWRAFGSELNVGELIAPSSLVALAVIFFILRALHELGHAAACKAMGGRSTEIGVLLIAMVIPLPYCDATSAWRFVETWRRVIVSLGGIFVELFIAAIAGIVWVVSSEHEGLVHVVAYQTMLISGITTIFFNINPLLRYDGYYILSDMTGVPNLAHKSKEMWKYLIERHVFGLRGLKPPEVRHKGDVWLLAVYGMCSVPYRIFVSVSILLLIMTRYAELGVALGIVFGVVWLLWPLLKGVGYLVSSPKLLGRRARAVGITTAFVTTLVALIGLVPLPASGYAPGTIEPRVLAPVRTGENGFVKRVEASAGEQLTTDEVIIELSNPDLETEAIIAAARVEGARAKLNNAYSQGPAYRQVAEIELNNKLKALEHARSRVEEMTVRSPAEGRLATMGGAGLSIHNLEGRFLERGQLIGMVASDDLVIVASVPDRVDGYVFGHDRSPSASVRVRGSAGQVHPARIVRRVPAGSYQLHSASIGTSAGGDVAIDPRDRDGARTMESRFIVELEPVEPIAGAQPGMRVRVRFGIEPMPLGRQVLRRVRQFLTTKLAS